MHQTTHAFKDKQIKYLHIIDAAAGAHQHFKLRELCFVILCVCVCLYVGVRVYVREKICV